MNYKTDDYVKFSLPCACGIGVVLEIDEEQNTCNLVVLNFEWLGEYKDNPEKQNSVENINEYYCDNVSVHNLAHLNEDDFSDEAKIYFIEQTDLNERELSKMTEDDKRRMRRFVNELADKGHFLGYYAKGFLTYGDTPIFKCDWETSRACLEKCVELKCDPYAANALGYICYYGRCNNGVPEYEKAFRYYSIAAFAGVHEAIYKSGDLFLNGYGVPENGELACKLYMRVYDETRPLICSGNVNNKFADAALRLARIFESRGYEDMEVYAMFLEADYAIRRRAFLNYYGDNRVSENIRKGIEQYTPKDKMTTVHEEGFPVLSYFSKRFLSPDVLRVSIERKGRKIKFRLRVVDAYRHKRSRRGILLVIPQLSYCGLVKSYSFSCMLEEDDKDCEIADGTKEVFYCTDIDDWIDDIVFERIDGNYIHFLTNDWFFRRPAKNDECKEKEPEDYWIRKNEPRI